MIRIEKEPNKQCFLFARNHSLPLLFAVVCRSEKKKCYERSVTRKRFLSPFFMVSYKLCSLSKPQLVVDRRKLSACSQQNPSQLNFWLGRLSRKITAAEWIFWFGVWGLGVCFRNFASVRSIFRWSHVINWFFQKLALRELRVKRYAWKTLTWETIQIASRPQGWI